MWAATTTQESHPIWKVWEQSITLVFQFVLVASDATFWIGYLGPGARSRECSIVVILSPSAVQHGHEEQLELTHPSVSVAPVGAP